MIQNNLQNNWSACLVYCNIFTQTWNWWSDAERKNERPNSRRWGRGRRKRKKKEKKGPVFTEWPLRGTEEDLMDFNWTCTLRGRGERQGQTKMRGRFDGGLYSKSSREAAPVFVIILKWQGESRKKKEREKERKKLCYLISVHIYSYLRYASSAHMLLNMGIRTEQYYNISILTTSYWKHLHILTHLNV